MCLLHRLVHEVLQLWFRRW